MTVPVARSQPKANVFFPQMPLMLWDGCVFGSLRRSNWNGPVLTLSARPKTRKYLVAWFAILIGYDWAQMELRHLRYFVAVAEEQNVTRAAVRLHVSQPPISRQIRDLEDELGIALFNREAKTVRLTEAGRVFLTEARIILQRADDAVQMAKAVAGGKHGEIHVGYAPSLTVELLPQALKYFRESNPGCFLRRISIEPSACRH